jgi:hypothetical protein
MLALLRRFKTHVILTLAGLLVAALATIKVQSSRNEKLDEKVRHYEIKEEADEIRARPVTRDKSAILDRM